MSWSIKKILKKQNGYELDIIKTDKGERIILRFPGESINNPHMWLGEPNSNNIRKAEELFKKFVNIKQNRDDVKRSGRVFDSPEVAWEEFNKNDRIVSKRKQFKTKEERNKFIEKLSKKDNFNRILATRDNTISAAAKAVKTDDVFPNYMKFMKEYKTIFDKEAKRIAKQATEDALKRDPEIAADNYNRQMNKLMDVCLAYHNIISQGFQDIRRELGGTRDKQFKIILKTRK